MAGAMSMLGFRNGIADYSRTRAMPRAVGAGECPERTLARWGAKSCSWCAGTLRASWQPRRILSASGERRYALVLETVSREENFSGCDRMNSQSSYRVTSQKTRPGSVR